MATQTLEMNLNNPNPPEHARSSPSIAKDAPLAGSNGRDRAGAPVGLFSGNANVQKKIRRAERFGVPVQLSEDEKRNSRAQRFGTASTMRGSDSSKKSEELKRKARAERFGITLPSEPADEEAKKKARLARFAPPTKTDSGEGDKRKARVLRFSEAASSSTPPKAAIVGKASGGA